VDLELQQLSVQMTEVLLRNSASSVASKIRAVKARKQDSDTIAELEEVVNELIADKNELTRIAQSFEQELVSQRISQSDIEYVTGNLVPILSVLLERAASDRGESETAVAQLMDIVRPILSVETVTILQLFGFNFKKAIGEPLTDLIARAIAARGLTGSSQLEEIQALSLRREIAIFDVMNDPEAFERYKTFLG